LRNVWRQRSLKRHSSANGVSRVATHTRQRKATKSFTRHCSIDLPSARHHRTPCPARTHSIRNPPPPPPFQTQPIHHRRRKTRESRWRRRLGAWRRAGTLRPARIPQPPHPNGMVHAGNNQRTTSTGRVHGRHGNPKAPHERGNHRESVIATPMNTRDEFCRLCSNTCPSLMASVGRRTSAARYHGLHSRRSTTRVGAHCKSRDGE